MSFLAQLRQKQNPVSPGGLQLCYFLGPSAQPSSARQAVVLSLGLRLATLENGLIRELGQPYVLQQVHIQLPPPFFGPADVEILRELVHGNAAWIGRAEGDLQNIDETWIKKLVTTGKCFTHEVMAALRWGDSIRVEPLWQIDTTGNQQLHWSRPRGTSFWPVSPIGVLVQDQVAHPCVSGLHEEAVSEMAGVAPLAIDQVENFIREKEPRWRDLQLPLPQALTPRICPGGVQPVLLCQSTDTFSVVFRYETNQICFYCDGIQHGATANFWTGDNLLVVPRQLELEKERVERIAGYISDCFPAGNISREGDNTWRPADKNIWKDLLLNHRRSLEALGLLIEFAPGFRHAYVAPERWHVTLEQGSNEWQLELDLLADGRKYGLLPLLEQLRVFNESLRGDYIELQMNGRILVLPGKVMRSLAEELEDLTEWYGGGGIPLGGIPLGGIPLGQLYRLRELQESLPEQTEWDGDLNLMQQAANLQAAPELLDPAASGVHAELRPYQWLGVCWLQHLKRVGFNGLLADDMGLGKTLQTLAHLSLEEKQGNLVQPALIVAPTSLLSNWAREARRFCPHLSVHVVHGGQRWQSWPQHQPHILITSYNLVVRDLDLWRQKPLSWLVLDEAQVIKNPSTHVSAAVRQLRVQHRLCLSGTPVENHLGELWALLDFLNPGVLGSQRQFKSYYQKPIELEGRADRLQLLLSRVAPLLLRRTKDQVARDLPPKTVVQQLIPLAEDQLSFYQQLKRNDWQNLAQEIEKETNAGRQQILLLTALTRLRQACCDPKLLRENNISSAKTEYCLEMLQSLVSEGRAALVFSQFTSMLDILAGHLTELNIRYVKLTGQSRNRAELVEAFQNGEAQVFLISLKAGGVGLNLTRADTVIHFDPWWNSAAEEQAADRAHRIGQTQPVFVYKLIAENTIEEKIAQLQENKAFLSAQINRQAQDTGTEFALRLEDLLRLWQEDDVSAGSAARH